jgi:hypothetical protein
MKQKWCLVGDTSGEVLTYQGRVIVHQNKAELEYLFPYNRVVPLPRIYGDGLTVALKDHPDMDAVVFPLDKNMDQFRKRTKK